MGALSLVCVREFELVEITYLFYFLQCLFIHKKKVRFFFTIYTKLNRAEIIPPNFIFECVYNEQNKNSCHF